MDRNAKRPASSSAYKKGHSGNPGGRPKAIVEVQQLARLETVDSIRALVRVRDAKSTPPAAIVAASIELLNRGWGRPPQSLTVSADADIVALHLVAARAAQLLEATAPPAPATLEGRVEPANSKASTLVDLSAPPPTE